MKKVKYTRSEQGEENRINSLPKNINHWKWTDTPSILTLHRRLHRTYGKASNHKCVCGAKAKDWALVGKKYTDNILDYVPLCRKCHINLDESWLKRNLDCYARKKDIKGRFIKK